MHTVCIMVLVESTLHKHDIALYIVATVSQFILVLRNINKGYDIILVCYVFA